MNLNYDRPWHLDKRAGYCDEVPLKARLILEDLDTNRRIDVINIWRLQTSWITKETLEEGRLSKVNHLYACDSGYFGEIELTADNFKKACNQAIALHKLIFPILYPHLYD